MTPGLAGCIASGDDERAWDDAVTGALEALGAAFDVIPDRAGRPTAACRRTWLDTFDWRLHRAGLTLEYAGRSRGGELLLSGRALSSSGAQGTSAPTLANAASPANADADADPIAQPVNGWQASRPHLMCELPDGPVASRIGDLVAPRALLPVATVTSTTTTHRLLNEDGKTVARLLVERASIPGPPPAPLAPRLAITEVRGYPGAARTAARLLGAAPGIEPATAQTETETEALRAVGRRPGDYSNKVDAGITAAQPASRSAATLLLRLLDTVEANIPGVLADTDTEFLHDLRVSVRRTRSALKLFGDALTGRGGLTEGEAAFFAAEFKWVGDLTTPTRDLDVHLLDFDDTARSLSAAKPDDLEPFRAYLEQRRRREFRLLVRGLKSARFVTLTRDWRDRLTTIADASPAKATGAPVRSGKDRQAAGLTTGALAMDRTRAAFAKTVRRGAAITPESPAEALHDLRKRAKELRYALEFFAPLHDRAAQAKVIGELKRLQDCLGEFQDTEVQVGEIRALATAMLAAGEAPAVTLLAMGEVTAGLALRQRAAREDFGRRFAAFAGIDGQRRISALLRGNRGGS